jgi:transcriptional regulator with XRE-family HTH domain
MLSENIKAIRKTKGLSQAELAVKCNVVRQTISKWEQGLSVPDSDMLVALSEALETPVSVLLGETVTEAKADDMGVIAQKITDKTGALCGISVVKADEDIMMITNDGTIIRTPADGIPLYGRPAAGVIVMKLYDGAKLVNFALTEKEKEEDEAAPAAESDVIEGEAAEITDEAEAEEIPADAEEAETAESEPGTDE